MKLLRSFIFIVFMTSIMQAIAQNQSLDKIVAVVNKDIITQSQVDNQVALMKRQMQESHVPVPDDNKLRQQVLNQLIDKRLQLQVAKRVGIEITDAQVDKAISDIAARNRMSVDQLKSAVESQGMNYNDYRQQIHEQMILTEVQMRAVGPVTVTNQEIDDFMKKNQSKITTGSYHVVDILIPLTASANKEQMAAAEKQAQKVAEFLQKTDDIQYVAKQTGAQANDLQWRSLNDLPDLFVDTVTKMSVGNVSQPIQAPNGIHVIKLLGERSVGNAVTKDEIRGLLFQQKITPKINAWVQELHKTAYIKIEN